MGDARQGSTATRASAEVRVGRRTVSFALDDPDDHVQRHLVRGRFYEADLLPTHGDLVWMRSTVLDVGANVGNHTVWYALRTRAARVYPFEPNPPTAALLRDTVESNGLAKVDLTHLGKGVGSRRRDLYVHAAPGEHNLGGTSLRKQGDVAVAVHPLDGLDFEGPISLVKIDVEGMELQVLDGAEALVAEHRPGLAVEVRTKHLAAFWAWVEAHDYHVVRAHKMYADNVNYVCVPRS